MSENRMADVYRNLQVVSRCLASDPNDSYDLDDLLKFVKSQQEDVEDMLHVLGQVRDLYLDLDLHGEHLALAMYEVVEKFRDRAEEPEDS